MSRSRRPPKRPKCFCGRSLVPYLGHTRQNWRHGACLVLEEVHGANERYRHFIVRKVPGFEDQLIRKYDISGHADRDPTDNVVGGQ